MNWHPAGVRSVVALAAHPDDIEIGAGGTLLRLAAETDARFTFICASGGDGDRAAEAAASATGLLGDRVDLVLGSWPDRLLPYADPVGLKEWLVEAATGLRPDVVFSPHLGDRHQDHRFIAELAWQLFRRSTIFEYEIPKWEGDRPDAGLLVSLTETLVDAKLDHLDRHFPSQHDKPWYHRDLFAAVLRLRGVEASTAFAEGFVARKLIW